MSLVRALLISNSTMHGEAFLEHCQAEVCDFLGKQVKTVTFIPFALADWDGYAAKATDAFKRMGYQCISAHEAGANVAEAEAYFVGGGNTFRLLKALYERNMFDSIKCRVESGAAVYMGASAGTNVATLSIRTTNDMPIVYPPSFDALGLVPFNINPHYVDPDPSSKHMGETREKRIQEFHEENAAPVVGIREGAMLRVDGGSLVLKGKTGGVLCRQNQALEQLAGGTDLSFLLPQT